MEEEKPSDTLGTYQIVLDVRCKDCLHFSYIKANVYRDICKNLGVLDKDRPCRHFLNNVSLTDLHNENDRRFADLVAQIPTSKLSAYAALFQQEKITRRQGFKHGEIVYLRLYSENYLSNYVRARIISASSKEVFVQGLRSRFRARLLPKSVHDAEGFARIRAALVEQNKIVDPNLKQYTTWQPKLPKVMSEYNPPTIDDFCNVLETKKRIIDKLAKLKKPLEKLAARKKKKKKIFMLRRAGKNR